MKKNFVLSIITGLLFAAAFPPFRTGFLAYAALVPFFLLLEGKSIGQAFRWGYITGFLVDLFTLYWIAWVTKAGFIGAILVLPLYFSIYAIIHVFLVKQFKHYAYLFLPFVWVFVEYIQSISEIAFPWTFLGYTQTYYLPWIQFAEFTSVFGVSFWIFLLNIFVYYLYKNYHSKSFVVRLCTGFLIVFILPAIYGFTVMSRPIQSDKSIKVGLVQGNIDPFAKWDSNLYESNYSTYDSLSHEFADSSLDLLVWPETATPFYLRYERKYLQRVRDLIDSLDVDLVTGTVDFEYDSTGDHLYYNSALGIAPNHLHIQRYSKMLLVPFSEHVPYKNYFPFNFLKNMLYDLALGVGDYSKGEKIKLFSFTKESGTGDQHTAFRYKVATSICYESVFPDQIRKMANEGADLLTIITNDAWFGKTSAPFQHAQYAAFRAIENRISIARCANTGVSCFIGPYGRLYKETPIFQPYTIANSVSLYHYATFYQAHGNVFAKMASLMTLVSLIVAAFFNFKNKWATQ